MAVIPDSPPPPPPPPLEEPQNSLNADACDAVTIPNDPPPPYPSRDRRHAPRLSAPRSSRGGRRMYIHTQVPSMDSQTSPVSPGAGHAIHTDEDIEPSETTLLLAPGGTRRSGRPRSYSHGSAVSAAPSLAQTVFSLFQTEDDNDGYYPPQHDQRTNDTEGSRDMMARGTGFFSVTAWKRYFRPLTKKAYYASFFHLTLVNFPYALAAWVYLFVFTVTGTTLLVALPLGAVLCFFNLFGARAFSRGELSLQYRFHYPLSYPPPYPPRPIFTRYREPTISEIESGHRGLIRETSFYRNTYAMFTDSTSYQALFYFLVIKPAITLLLSIAIWAFGVPLMVLVIPAPAVLRAVRRLGIWQANVAIEGLYLAVR